MDIYMFNWSFFRKTLLAVIFVELLSFVAYIVPSFESVAFLILLVMVLFFSLENLFWGVSIAVTELIIGSFGYLFVLPLGGTNVSIRMGIFLVVCSVSLLHFAREKKFLFVKSSLLTYYLILAAMVILGIFSGVLRDNETSNIFFDANAFLFFAYVPILYSVLTAENRLYDLLSVATGALVGSLLKTFVLLYMFSHEIWYFMSVLYGWVRDTRVGEITRISDGMYRIFFQSHIFLFVGLFVVLFLLLISHILPAKHTRSVFGTHAVKWFFVLAVGLTAGVLISMSRSFWLAALVVLSVFSVLLFFYVRPRINTLLRMIFLYMGILFAALIVLFVITRFPYPTVDFNRMSTTQALAQRSVSLKGEAAVSSRWALLPKLWNAILSHPILGSGFGATVTYTSGDPRVIAQSAGQSGEYTTFAFEWGYLDLWFKMGIPGVLAYIILLSYLLFSGIVNFPWNALQRHSLSVFHVIRLSMISSLFFVSIVHFFTPYLNHPLGIILLIISGIIIEFPINEYDQ